MALIQCPECKKEVSSTAPTCPHCGYQLKKPIQTYSSQNKSRAQELYEKEHDRKYKEMIVGGIICIIAAICFLFFLGHPAVEYSPDLKGTIIGSSIGFAIGGVILLGVGIHRLNE